MAEEIKNAVDNDQQGEVKLVENLSNEDSMEIKEQTIQEGNKEQEMSAQDKIKDLQWKMSSIKIGTSYTSAYDNSFFQISKFCQQYKPFMEISCSREKGTGESIFWIQLAHSEEQLYKLRANSDSLYVLVEYILGGELKGSIDFDNKDFDGLELPWEVFFLEGIYENTKLKVRCGKTDTVYIEHRAKYGVLKFSLKETEKVKYIVAKIMQK